MGSLRTKAQVGHPLNNPLIQKGEEGIMQGPIRVGLGGFTSHPKSKEALPRAAKHKADAIALSTYLGDGRPMPLHSYTDRWVLKVASLSPFSDAKLGVLEALRVTYNVPDHAPFPPPAIPAAPSDQLPLAPLAPAAEPVVVISSSEEYEVASRLLRRYFPFHVLSSFVEPFVAFILTWAHVLGLASFLENQPPESLRCYPGPLRHRGQYFSGLEGKSICFHSSSSIGPRLESSA
ncbi:hypothetical protein LIER_28731 [Lithospermum erythrorhizon]|uniref:Uncharacterized protein n=1 Tax=Lithospermum erythrorhizon TaxID=34254 RepID=A0AAV3RMN9_LITER